jgi:hypothetical protein
MKEGGLGGTYIMKGVDEKFVQNLCRKTLKRRDHFEDIGLDGRIILK